jgi:hypothetical protein
MFVANLAADDQDDNFVSFNIIQGAQVAYPQLEVSERIGTQSRGAIQRFLPAGRSGRCQQDV